MNKDKTICTFRHITSIFVISAVSLTATSVVSGCSTKEKTKDNLESYDTDSLFEAPISEAEDVEEITVKEYDSLAADLGLSVKWARCNLGASSPEDVGGYYAFGETKVKRTYSFDNYKYSSNESDRYVKYNEEDGRKQLDPTDDAAAITLGSPWRMPTEEEFEELISGCEYRWSNHNGIDGYVFIGHTGDSIFLPAAGYMGYDGHETFNRYWSSTVANERQGYALTFTKEGYRPFVRSDYCRTDGCQIRPVKP